MLIFIPMLDPDIDIDSDPLDGLNERVWTVSQITSRVKNILEGEPAFSSISVRGEITNLSPSKAGHIYFGLKDQKAYLKCVAFRGDAQKLKMQPQEGREVVATGRINVWETGGTYQLIVSQLQDVGLGALWLQFEETRRKLAEEGLFDEAHKVPLPQFPRTIGIVTSQSGAALRDMIRIFTEVAPYVKLILSPSLVQGETAPVSLIGAINLLEMWDEVERSEGREGLDSIIVGRGGGSFEDLACFNDEALIRRVYELEIPVISAVGHEIDYTILDFVADLRAATPTQAAQIAAPSSAELLQKISEMLSEHKQAAEMKVETYSTGLMNILSRTVFRRPLDRINNLHQSIDLYSGRCSRAVAGHLKILKHRFQSMVNRLNTLDPEAILSRGYSLAFEADTGRLITKTAHVKSGAPVDLRVSDGIIKLKVSEEEQHR
ncbi:MAG: exodeoxyribonuclease VII large subunit [bacterium]|nr:exodeoxyribonuclease VII large subunit [bacterium]